MRLIDAASNLSHRAMLMTIYSRFVLPKVIDLRREPHLGKKYANRKKQNNKDDARE